MIHGRLAKDHLLVPITRQAVSAVTCHWPSRRVNSTTFNTCLSIQNDSVSLYQKISSQLLSYITVTIPIACPSITDIIPLHLSSMAPTTSPRLTTSLVTNGTRLLALGRDLDHHNLARTPYSSIGLEPHEGLYPLFKFTPWSGSSGLSLHLKRLRPDLSRFFSTSLQRQTRLKHVALCSDVHKRTDLHLGRWCPACGLNGRLTHSQKRTSSHLWTRAHRYWAAMLAVSVG